MEVQDIWKKKILTTGKFKCLMNCFANQPQIPLKTRVLLLSCISYGKASNVPEITDSVFLITYSGLSFLIRQPVNFSCR